MKGACFNTRADNPFTMGAQISGAAGEVPEFSGWRPRREHKPKHKDKSEIKVLPPIRFFDNLSFIGDSGVGCFVVETSDGLIMLDCQWPTDECVLHIEEGFQRLGLKEADLKYILISHGHPDHFGRADYFRDKCGCKIFMSETDYNYARNRERHTLPYEVDGYLEDMSNFVLGDTAIRCVSTPGHSPGGFSFVIPVFDEGRPHMAGLWGGAGLFPSHTLEEKQTYLASLNKFSQVGEEMGIDVEISTHPFIDCAEERFEVCRNIVDGVANPFVIGREAYKRYENMFRELCEGLM